MSFLKTSALVGSLAVLTACTGGGGGTVGGGSSSTYGTYQSPLVTASEFVSALNRVGSLESSYVELYADETYRSAVVGQDDWFVIYDDKYNEYKAVSLQYIRSIVYYDYYSSTSSLADEFRDIERDDILSGELNGDYYGDDYEVVDYDYYTDTYVGRNSGYDYEDEASSNDVSLLSAEAQQKEFFQKAANVSLAYNLSIETSLSLVTLGQKTEQIVGKSKGELTVADQVAFANDLQRLAGVSAAEVMAAANDSAAQSELVGKIANKIGTSAANLENRILPELLGVEL